MKEELEKFVALPDETLCKAYRILMQHLGPDWKRIWSARDKANEMRSIIHGGTQPCVPFESWVQTIDYLRSA